MSRYPTENSLTINNTHQMLETLESDADRLAATSPTRKDERGLGYDVQLSFAQRIQFQYKRPQYVHSNRGLCFEVNSDQVATLRFRDDVGVAFLACPYVTNRSQLPTSLNKSFFIDVQAVRANTTRLYIPENYPRSGTVTARYNDGNTSYYYEIPEYAISTWSNIESGIQTRAIGQVVRDNGDLTQPYRDFVRRLTALKRLYDPSMPVRADGGDDSSNEPDVNFEAREQLISHAEQGHRRIYSDHIAEEDSLQEALSQDRSGLKNTVRNMKGIEDPQVHRIRRSRDIIVEEGNQTERKLNLGRREQE